MSSLFTQILNGETPGHVLWQDDLCYCLLTPKPLCEGHVLVVPRQEFDYWDEMGSELTAHAFNAAAAISRVIRQLFPCRKTGMMIGGLEVRHAHIHLVPINAVAELNFTLASAREESLQSATAARIREALANLHV